MKSLDISIVKVLNTLNVYLTHIQSNIRKNSDMHYFVLISIGKGVKNTQFLVSNHDPLYVSN